jgi:hypothetical protein
MIAGSKKLFSIEAKIKSSQENWVFGSIRFWIDSKPIGNWDDITALNACYNWIQGFSFGKNDNKAEDLFNLPPIQAYELIMAELRGSPTNYGRNLDIKDPMSFDISVLGMSSFDNLDILMIKNEAGIEKCIWKIGNGNVEQFLLPANEMERVASEFCAEFEKEAPQLANKKYPEKES